MSNRLSTLSSVWPLSAVHAIRFLLPCPGRGAERNIVSEERQSGVSVLYRPIPVCPHASLWNHTSEVTNFFAHVRRCYLWPAAAVRSFMHSIGCTDKPLSTDRTNVDSGDGARLELPVVIKFCDVLSVEGDADDM